MILQPAAAREIIIRSQAFSTLRFAESPLHELTETGKPFIAADYEPLNPFPRLLVTNASWLSPKDDAVQPAQVRPADCAETVPLPIRVASEGNATVPRIIRPGQPDVFGSVALPVSRTALDQKWRQATSATLASHSGPWSGVIGQSRRLSRLAQIRTVNAWVNARISYIEDVRQHGIADRWAPANQSLSRGRGDCEDYAIAKMQMLRALGVPADEMFLVVARDLVRRADHAVLAVAVDGDLLILDNETDRVLSSSEVKDYRPVLTFNAVGSWTHGYRTAPSAATLRYAALDR